MPFDYRTKLFFDVKGTEKYAQEHERIFKKDRDTVDEKYEVTKKGGKVTYKPKKGAT